jgi:hypothetical protein
MLVVVSTATAALGSSRLACEGLIVSWGNLRGLMRDFEVYRVCELRANKLTARMAAILEENGGGTNSMRSMCANAAKADVRNIDCSRVGEN